jgi:hypothetical protein
MESIDLLILLADYWPAGMSRLGAVACGLAVGVWAIWLVARRGAGRQRVAPHSPQQLFQELCQAHRLSAAQQRLMEWVINDLQLPQPAMLFLEPLLLERAMTRSDTPGVRKRLADLRSRLFAGMRNAGELDG